MYLSWVSRFGRTKYADGNHDFCWMPKDQGEDPFFLTKYREVDEPQLAEFYGYIYICTYVYIYIYIHVLLGIYATKYMYIAHVYIYIYIYISNVYMYIFIHQY